MFNKIGTGIKIGKKEVTGGNINLSIQSEIPQIVNIRITNMLKENKFSTWEEINTGSNCIVLNLAKLPKGIYRVTVTMDQGRVYFEDFTKY